MGKPGGFFKRLLAKQSRQAKSKRRGTKGASKEERRRKKQEQAIYYAAKREAEQLAEVSSSSDDDADELLSTDSEEVLASRQKGIRRLHSVLHVRSSARHGKMKQPSAKTTEDDSSHHQSRKANRKGEEEEGEDDNSSDEEEAALAARLRAELTAQQHTPAWQRGRSARGLTSRTALTPTLPLEGEKDDDLELEAEKGDALSSGDEDWREIIGDNSEEPSETEEEEDGLWADLDDEDEDEDEDEEGVENPLLAMQDGEEEYDDDGQHLFDRVMEFEPAVEEDVEDDEEGDLEEEDEEIGETDTEDREEAYVEEDELESHRTVQPPAASSKPTTKKHRAGDEANDEAATAAALLLPSFQLGHSAMDTLVKSGVVQPDDPWFRKYHLNQAPDVSAIKSIKGNKEDSPSAPAEMSNTRLEPMPISAVALEALDHSYEPYQRQAQRDLEAMAAQKLRRLPSFVRAEDFAALPPARNVALDTTEIGRQTLLHSPFEPPSVASPSSSPEALVKVAALERPEYLHPWLWERWQRFRDTQRQADGSSEALQTTVPLPYFTPEERGLLDLCMGYADVLDTTRAWQKTQSRREILSLHLLNHWLKAQAVVAAHDTLLEERRSQRRAARRRVKQQKQKQKKAADKPTQSATGKKRRRAARSDLGEDEEMESESHEESSEEDVDDLQLRDRGFSKSRMIVLLPMRHQAYLYVHTMVQILGADPNDCPKLGVFQQDFTEVEEAMDPTFRKRPRDYQREFEGNIDDSFCVGIKLEPQRLSVYAHPLNSDLILCSPLGLRRRIEKNGDAMVSLSSMEVCVVDYAHVLLEQNWEHVAVVLEELLNQRPNDTTRGLSDLRRTYAWALENQSASHRQTIISSDVLVAPMLNTYRAMPNSWGKLLLRPCTYPGVLTQVKVPVPQHFLRFVPRTIATCDEERFAYFTQDVFPKRLNPLAERDIRLIIYVPSYFDFVRLRHFFHREYRETYAALSEYSSLKQQRKALGQFSDLERPVLLVTERFYYFKRYFVSKSEAVVFYSPALLPQFYVSFVNRLVADSPNSFAMTIFSRYDVHELARIAGHTKAQQLLQRDSNVYSFMTS